MPDRTPTSERLTAQEIADMISAQERVRIGARADGDAGLLTDCARRIQDLRKEAIKLGFTSDTHPGLFR